MRMIVFGSVCLVLVACVSNPKIESLSPSERETFNRIQILQGEISQPYTIISEVKGKECHETIDQSKMATTDSAITVIKIKAAKKNADAVIDVKCRPSRTTDWRNDCWSSMLCVGTAIKFQ